MPCQTLVSITVLLFSFFFTSIAGCYAEDRKVSIAFAGDVLLCRVVAAEATELKTRPWEKIEKYLSNWDYVAANFEGSVSTADPKKPLCFAVIEDDLKSWGKLPFHALGNENNHSDDLGDSGRKLTNDFLESQSIKVLSWDKSPAVIEIKGYRIAVISLNETGKTINEIRLIHESLLQKIRMAKFLADISVINIHWGIEHVSWPNEQMSREARWFIDNGADIVIGHHPHVIISPEVYKNRPIYYSLGNFIFDQKYPQTKEGLIAVCEINGLKASFSACRAKTPANSTLPNEVIPDIGCTETLRKAVFQVGRKNLKFGDIDVYPEVGSAPGKISVKLFKKNILIWETQDMPIISIYKSRLRPKLDKEVLICLERHYSSIDGENAPRPYVYDVTENGLTALWRGSALAWPLADLDFISSTNEDYLCALHRGDNFLEMEPNNTLRKTAFYRWNGFGFNIVENVPGPIVREIKKQWLQGFEIK